MGSPTGISPSRQPSHCPIPLCPSTPARPVVVGVGAAFVSGQSISPALGVRRAVGTMPAESGAQGRPSGGLCTKSNYSEPPRELALIEKSLILPFSTTRPGNKGPGFLTGCGRDGREGGPGHAPPHTYWPAGLQESGKSRAPFSPLPLILYTLSVFSAGQKLPSWFMGDLEEAGPVHVSVHVRACAHMC